MRHITVQNAGWTTWPAGWRLERVRGAVTTWVDSFDLPLMRPRDAFTAVSVAGSRSEEIGRLEETWEILDDQRRAVPFGEAGDFDLRLWVVGDDEAVVRWTWPPDGAELQPGVPTVGAWALRNTGSSTWGPGWRRRGDGVLADAQTVSFEREVPPGDEIVVAVALIPLDDGRRRWRDDWAIRSPLERVVPVARELPGGRTTPGAMGAWFWTDARRHDPCRP